MTPPLPSGPLPDPNLASKVEPMTRTTSTKRRRKKNVPKNKDKDTLSPREIEREYGFAYKFLKSDPELWQLVKKAIEGNWSPERFQARLQDTKWFKKHSDIWRQNTALKFTDPQTYKERLKNYRTQVKNLAGQWGADLTERELRRYSERALLFGWSEAQILDGIAKEVRPQGGSFKGGLASVEAELRRVAANNGVRLNNKQLTKWMRRIVRGEADSRQFETVIRKMAAKTFDAYGQEILSGMDAVDVAAPYIQSMSEILELNPADVNLFDPTIRKALSFRDPKTKEPAPLSVADFEDQLRADKRWQYTDNAHEQLTQYAVELGKMFGVLS